jgi:uncharacterized protein YndB with AHSA1/START domain
MSVFCVPDLKNRSFELEVERKMRASPSALYVAWTRQFDRWFAAPGSVLMQGATDTPYFFETVYEDQRHPHYGRFLRLTPDRLVELTWVTGQGGTAGAETVVTVGLSPQAAGTLLHLRHAGFPDEASRKQHADAWPLVLEQMDARIG